MKLKLMIITTLFWTACIITGGYYDRVNSYLEIQQSRSDIQQLRDLYSAGLYVEALQACNAVEKQTKYIEFRPQIAFIRWCSYRHLGRARKAAAAKAAFLTQYSRHPLAADIHFAAAMDALARGDYAFVNREFRLIENFYPTAAVTAQVRRLQRQIPTN